MDPELETMLREIVLGIDEQQPVPHNHDKRENEMDHTTREQVMGWTLKECEGCGNRCEIV